MGALRRGIGSVVLLAGATLCPLFAPDAAAQQPAAVFGCRASPANLLGVEPVVANPAEVPCTADTEGIGSFPPGPGGVDALSATTHIAPGNGGVIARTTVMGIDVPLLSETVSVGLIQSEAAVTCESGQARLSGSSRVQGLSIGGEQIADEEQRDLALGVGVLHLNHRLTVGGTITVRPIWLETPIGNVILGEARAGHAGDPCGGIIGDRSASITIVKDAAPESGQAFSFDGGLGPFSLTDDGGPSGRDRRTFSVPPGQYTIRELPVTTGRFAEDWTLESVDCRDGQARFNRAAGRIDVQLDPGESVVCTFHNDNPPFAEAVLGVNPAGETGAEPPTRQLTGVGLDPTGEGGDGGGGQGSSGARAGDQAGSRSRETQSSGLSGAVVPLVGLPLLAGIGAAIWLFLAAGRRRRDQDAGS